MRTLLALTLALVSTAHAKDTKEAKSSRGVGMFGGIGFGFADGNFDIETAEEKETTGDKGNFGDAFEAHLGYAFDNQFGIGIGISLNRYVYEVSALGFKGEMALNFNATDISGYYFIPLSPTWEVGLRAGISKTSATQELGKLESKEKESDGVHVAVDIDWIFGDNASLMIQLYSRTYGLTFKNIDDNKELGATGMLLGVRWR